MVQPGWSSKCFFTLASTNLWGTPLFVWKQKIQTFLSCDRHCMLGSIWLIQVSIVTLLVGRPCHLSHTSHKKGHNQNKLINIPKLWSVLENIQWIWQTSSYWKKTVSLLRFAYFETRRGSLHPKKWLSSYKRCGKVKTLPETLKY